MGAWRGWWMQRSGGSGGRELAVADADLPLDIITYLVLAHAGTHGATTNILLESMCYSRLAGC